MTTKREHGGDRSVAFEVVAKNIAFDPKDGPWNFLAAGSFRFSISSKFVHLLAFVCEMATVSSRAYLPLCWEDDAKMTGLMSLPKARHVNPVNYDRVIRFWTDAINKYCENSKTACVTLSQLKRAFLRGSQIPSPLKVVLEDMYKNGAFQTVETMQSNNNSWLSWGAGLLSSTLWGRNEPDYDRTVFVHCDTLKMQARSVLELYKTEYEMVDCPEVVEYEDLKERSAEICPTKDNYELVVLELERQGELTIGCSSKGEKILKFRDHGSRGPVQFTKADATIHDIRRQLTKIEKDIHRLEEHVKKHDANARRTIRSGDKVMAAAHLRKKKKVEKDIQDKDAQYQKLITILEQLSQSKHTNEILSAYRAGNEAFKATMSSHGLTADKVDETMDSIHDAMQDYNEVQDALRQPLPASAHDVDESMLEAELDELLSDAEKEKKEAAISDLNLPEVPSLSPSKEMANARGSMAPLKPTASLEERLKRLRAVAH
ncbi:hypothetical protein QR680_005183 [Steinernema hermaphroditum]|uniref:CHMP7 winged helix domain-containing protein n=1 Tax=Steinernema hermaphroditum TaxID=289476 RepID=A0AA39LUW4_9BILA|nr:hypothetical protein QR680_005183 [Steinernema hermaphroditum]